ncbi:MAG: acyltransferase [Proteobacteria bacterium]|uniref:acyltransferase family protein n=1 Tax=Rudaea sp. TaxID=2136325 RepID=UPI001E165023|nr:acyltransferase [Pseudomonadota bacterium]MBS0568187.1 acyltransferase [Pseudomonadota bacterium]
MQDDRVNEIDLLRFLAALSVVFFHYSFRGYAADSLSVMPYPMLAPVSKYGYFGVELFFMISGFVILMTAASGSLRGFIVSRIVRLYPAFWACCTITFVITIAVGAPRYFASFGQYLANMTMLSGFFNVPSIDGVYWSLFVEIRFYLMVAVLLTFGMIEKAQIFIVGWIICSILLEIFPVERLQTLLITEYSPYFAAGATYFLIWKNGFSAARIATISTAWGLAVYQSLRGLKGFVAHFHTDMNGWIVAMIVTTFFVVMLLVALRRTGLFGRTRWLLLGSLTYPLYLLHQHIGYIVFNAAYPAINKHLLFWGTIMAVVALAHAVHVLIEKPISSPMKAALNRLSDRVQRLALRSN